MADPIRLILELKVNPDVFDLTHYTESAVSDGWGNDPENGAWYLAEEIASEYSTFGCSLEVIP